MRVRPDVEALALELHKIGASADPPKLYPILEKALDEARENGRTAHGWAKAYGDYLTGTGSRTEAESFALLERAAARIQSQLPDILAPALPQGDGAGE